MLRGLCVASARRSAITAGAGRLRASLARAHAGALGAATGGSSAVHRAALVAALHGWARPSVPARAQYGVNVTSGTGFGAAGDPERKSAKEKDAQAQAQAQGQAQTQSGGAGVGPGMDEQWVPPNIEQLYARYQAAYERRTRYLLVVFAALATGMSFRMIRSKSRYEETLKAKDSQIQKLKSTSDANALADRVLTLVDTARDNKHDFATLRAALVREFEASRAAGAAASAAAPAAAATAPVASAAAKPATSSPFKA